MKEIKQKPVLSSIAYFEGSLEAKVTFKQKAYTYRTTDPFTIRKVAYHKIFTFKLWNLIKKHSELIHKEEL